MATETYEKLIKEIAYLNQNEICTWLDWSKMWTKTKPEQTKTARIWNTGKDKDAEQLKLTHVTDWTIIWDKLLEKLTKSGVCA